MQTPTELDAELCALWVRRRDLDEASWIRLFKIVEGVLLGYKPRELAGLPEDRSEYVQKYFVERVFRTDLLSRCDHTGALRSYYRNFLRDELRSRNSRLSFEVPDGHHPENESPPSLNEAPNAENEVDPLTALEEAGFPPAKVAASAVAWLAESEEWVRIFVAYSNCPDAGLSEPLVHLARRKGISSRAYRAAQLGFNWKGSDHTGFATTSLGRWISESLGIEIAPENAILIHGALKILCLEALLWAEQQEVAQ
jgi:hypothetical protein